MRSFGIVEGHDIEFCLRHICENLRPSMDQINELQVLVCLDYMYVMY